MGADPYIGQTVGSFRIEEKLGEGGMGAVYRAMHTTLQREAAFKILPPHLVRDNPTFAKRFLVEARAAARLNHPNIVQVYDAGEIDKIYFIAMEFVRGLNLREMHQRSGSLPEAAALEVAIQAASGLEAAQRENIIHRDVKPDNLMVTQDGVVKVADFGLAKNLDASVNLTQTGQVIGTPTYMSPEQGEGEPADFRSDIYSLGGTLYELVTEQKPYRASTPLGVLMAHVKEPVPDPSKVRPGLHPGTSATIQRMMAKDRNDRFQSYGSLILALSEVKDELERKGNQIGLEILVKHAGGDPAKDTGRIRTLALQRETRAVPTKRRSTSFYVAAHHREHSPRTHAIYGVALAVLVLGSLALILAFTGVFGSGTGAEGSGGGTEEGGGGEKKDEGTGPTLPMGERAEKRIRDLLAQADGLEQRQMHAEALAVLREAATLELEPLASDSAKEVLATARTRHDLAAARDAEIRGEVDEALRLAERAGTHGRPLPRLAPYVKRLEGKAEILRKFPPSKGWTRERRDRIRLKVLNGLPVSVEEKEFYRRFDEWAMGLDPVGCGLDAKPVTKPPEPSSPESPAVERPEILNRFPPEKGWGAERRKQIMLKMVRGDDPSAEEKEFYRRYQEWTKAMAASEGGKK